MKNVLHCDGYTLDSNPSPTGGGFVIVRENRTQPLLHKKINQPVTNNDTELEAIKWGAILAPRNGKLVTDSKTIVSWITNGRSESRPDLLDSILMTQEIIQEKNLKIEWRPRDENDAGIYIEYVLQA